MPNSKREAMLLLREATRTLRFKRGSGPLPLARLAELPNTHQRVISRCEKLAKSPVGQFWSSVHGISVTFPIASAGGEVFFDQRDHAFFAERSVAAVIRSFSVGRGEISVGLTTPETGDWWTG